MRGDTNPKLPFDAQPTPPLRRGGEFRRRFDRSLRGALALALPLASWHHGVGVEPVAFAHTAVGAALVCAFAHAAPRAPRATSGVSFALAVGAWIATGATALFALIATLSILRLALHGGEAGAWLLDVHRVERRRRRALVATGLALGHGSARALAGDLYEEAGWARQDLARLGARPGVAALWRPLGRVAARILCGVPGVGSIARPALARRLRGIAAKLMRMRGAAEA